MLLAPQEAQLFFKLHRSLMCFVNQRLGVVPDIATPEQFAALAPEARLEVREAFLKEPRLIGAFVEANPYGMTEEELGIIASWRHYVAGEFFILRYLQKYAVFLAANEPAVAYGVLALSEPLADLVGPRLPIWGKTVLLPFRGQIVYDGLIGGYNVSFGPGIRRSLNEDYKEAKARLGIVTSLPVEARPAGNAKPRKRTAPVRSRASASERRDVLAGIVGMTDSFCREHLNDEFAELCRKLAEKLARNRPSPLTSGRPEGWACGIVRTIGWVNFLSDPSQTPHMTAAAVNEAFGVSDSTAATKLAAIRNLLKLMPLDPEWTLPSRADDNPLTWLLEVNGLMLDIRHCPREVQEVAFKSRRMGGSHQSTVPRSR